MIIIFDWLGDIISGIGDAIGNAIDVVESGIANAIWNAMLRWIYEIIYGAIADCFEMIGGMSAEVFDLEWVQATVKLFTLFGWGLFVAGTVVAVFDVAIEYQCGRANIKTTALNILKGFFACSLIGVVPIELYKFCISLQNTFSHDLIGIASSGINSSLADVGLSALVRLFSPSIGTTFSLLNLLCMIAFAYCVIKMFFANNLWLWSLRDFVILAVAALLSVLALVQLHIFLPAVVVLCYGFLTIRMDDTTVMDFMRYAVRYLISTQQYFEWR